MTSQPRPVWADDNDADALLWAANHAEAHGLDGWAQDLRSLYEQHGAAPADAAEAVAAWFGDHFTGLDEYDRTHLDEMAASLLGALGYPHTEQA